MTNILAVVIALVATTPLAAAGNLVTNALEARGLVLENLDVCDNSKTGFKDETEQTILCYVGNFLVRMLTELNGGEEKTSVHVRTHMLPYLAGPQGVAALLSDKASDPSCLVCMTDPKLSKATADLRRALDAAVVEKYDALGICYSTLVDRIINELPKDKEGVKLIPHEAFKTDPVRQAVGMFRALFVNHAYNTLSCRRTGGTGHSALFGHVIGNRLGGRKNVHTAIPDDEVGKRMGDMVRGVKNILHGRSGKEHGPAADYQDQAGPAEEAAPASMLDKFKSVVGLSQRADAEAAAAARAQEEAAAEAAAAANAPKKKSMLQSVESAVGLGKTNDEDAPAAEAEVDTAEEPAAADAPKKKSMLQSIGSVVGLGKTEEEEEPAAEFAAAEAQVDVAEEPAAADAPKKKSMLQSIGSVVGLGKTEEEEEPAAEFAAAEAQVDVAEEPAAADAPKKKSMLQSIGSAVGLGKTDNEEAPAADVEVDAGAVFDSVRADEEAPAGNSPIGEGDQEKKTLFDAMNEITAKADKTRRRRSLLSFLDSILSAVGMGKEDDPIFAASVVADPAEVIAATLPAAAGKSAAAAATLPAVTFASDAKVAVSNPEDQDVQFFALTPQASAPHVVPPHHGRTKYTNVKMRDLGRHKFTPKAGKPAAVAAADKRLRKLKQRYEPQDR